MTKTGYSMLVALVLAFATAAAHADPDGGLVEKVVLITERIAAEVDANKPDCEKIGVALAKHQDADIATLKDFADTVAKLRRTERNAVRELIKHQYGERLKAATAKSQPLGACKDNAKIAAYLKQVVRR